MKRATKKNPNRLNIGGKVRKLREIKNYTQDYMACQLDISVSNYSKLERNEVALTIDRLQEIAQLLELSVVEIISFDELHLLPCGQKKGLIPNGAANADTFPTIPLVNRVRELEERLNRLENGDRGVNASYISMFGKR